MQEIRATTDTSAMHLADVTFWEMLLEQDKLLKYLETKHAHLWKQLQEVLMHVGELQNQVLVSILVRGRPMLLSRHLTLYT